MYKVKYTKLAIMKDGTIGNISQGGDTAYMDCGLKNIEALLTNDLLDKKRCPVINNIEKINGHVVIYPKCT